MSEVDLFSLTVTGGGAFLIGLIIGGAMKHLFKVFAFLVGLKIAIIAYAEHINYLNIQWSQIGGDLDIFIAVIRSAGSPEGYEQAEVLDVFGILTGLLIGIAIGFRFG